MSKDKSKGKPGDVMCEECGKRIPKPRLAVLPGTTTCVKCATELEELHGPPPPTAMEDGYDPQELIDSVTPDE